MKLTLCLLISKASVAQTADDPTIAAPLDRWLADKSAVFDARDVDIDQFLWRARPVVIFADTPSDPAFRRQLDLLHANNAALAERDVVVIVDYDKEELSDVRRKLRPRGFALVLIGKDGGIKLRKPRPWDIRELSRVIDKMPMRKQEIRERQ